MTVFSNAEFDAHDLVQFVNEPHSGLRAIIALHRASPRAAGGIRMKAYPNDDDALRDALRLSRAMSYKFAFAGIDRGGGKTVIIGDPQRDKTPALLQALGSAIDGLSGRYFGGADSGTDAADMRTIARVTRYIRGNNPDHGDGSAATAYGVLQGILASVEHQLGRDTLAGVTVAVQGVGHVGKQLAIMLSERGATLIIADADVGLAEKVGKDLGARVVDTNAITTADVDVFAPCAHGGVLDATTVPALRAKIVCGGANNQLAADSLADELDARGILYVPDYVANAGGILNAMVEGRHFDRAQLWKRLERISADCSSIFAAASAHRSTTLAEANRLAEANLRGFADARQKEADSSLPASGRVA